MTTMDTPLSTPAAEAADSQPATDGPMGLAAVPCSASDVEVVPRKVTMMADVMERQMRGERIAIIGGGQSWGKTMAMRIAMAVSAQPMPLVIVDSKPNVLALARAGAENSTEETDNQNGN